MACVKASTAASIDKEQNEPRHVMFLCDEWKSSRGGLSTFNREFAINLAKSTTDSMKIHCYVSKSDDRDREDARQHGVNLITAQSVPGSADPLDWLKIPPQELPHPDIVIGHGRKFGTPTYFIVKASKSKWIQFVHVFCEDLGKYKETKRAALDTIEENEKKHKMEIELCKAADAVVAVGSRLQQKYSRSLPNVKVEIITPGIFEKFSSESQFALDRSVVKKFNVFMFGRATFEDLTLKGYDIVANAIGSLGRDFELTFVGSSPGEHQKVEQWFLEKTCITRNQLTICGYISEQGELQMMFHQSDLVAMPSRTEGFGLVSLEAISAGVPVLVSGESGIAEALQDVEGGKSVIVEFDDNVEEWARRIKQLSSQSPEQRQHKALQLRENYRKVYSWRTECEKFKMIIQNVGQSANVMKVKIDVKTLEPAKCKTQNINPVLPAESIGCQDSQPQEVSTASRTLGHTQPGETEVPQVVKSIPSEREVLCLIASKYLEDISPRSKEDYNNFLTFMEKMRVTITGVAVGSLVITVKCDSLQSLEELWEHYSSGHLGEMVQNCFVTEEILKELNLAAVKLQTTMEEDEYKTCKVYFEKDRGTFPLMPHLVESTESDEILKQKMELLKLRRITGSLPKPLLVSSVSGGKQKQEHLLQEQAKQEMENIESKSTTGKKRKRPPPFKFKHHVYFPKVYPLVPRELALASPELSSPAFSKNLLRDDATGTLIVDGKIFDNADDLKEVKRLGHGSCGVVYKMIHEPTGYSMAVKRIALGESIKSGEQRRLLLDLENSLRVNDHPHTVHVYGTFLKEGDLLICMELMTTSLEKFYEKVYATPGRRIPEEVLQEISFAVCTCFVLDNIPARAEVNKASVEMVHALNYLHGTLHIVHRDIKPSNILVSDKGNFKLSDFGISGHLLDSLEKTVVGGGRCYLAPERINPDRHMQGYDSVSDIWSLGITLVELATGEYPYLQYKTSFELLDRILNEPPLTLPDEGPYSEKFSDFVAQCLQKDYKKRPNAVLLMKHDFLKGNGTGSGFDTKSWITSILQELEQP